MIACPSHRTDLRPIDNCFLSGDPRQRLQHYFSTYKLVPGKEVDIKVDFVYGREEALKVIAAAEKDYDNHFGHLHTQAKARE